MNSQDLTYFHDKPQMTRKQYMRLRAKTLIYVPDDGPRYMKVLILIRILLFILTFTLFILLIYLAASPQPRLRDVSGIYLTGLTCAFLFFDFMHVIGHFNVEKPLEYPMIFGSFIGSFFFFFIGLLISYLAPYLTWVRWCFVLLCFTIAFLHAADVILAIIYWRYKHLNRRKSGPPPNDMTTIGANYDAGSGGGGYPVHFQGNNTYTKSNHLRKYDVHTSTGGAIAKGRHGEYQYEESNRARVANQTYNMECPNHYVKSDYPMIAARSMQTGASSVQREAQTTRIDVKENPAKICNQCDLCLRHLAQNQVDPEQYRGPPIRDTLPRKFQAAATSTPLHSVSSSSNMTQQNIQYSTTPSGIKKYPCCQSCDCSGKKHGKTLPMQYLPQSPPNQQHTENLESVDRQIVSTIGTDPNHNLNTMSTNVQSGNIISYATVETVEEEQLAESQQVYESRTSPKTKPIMGKLASISGCLSKSSSSTVLIRKNKRTQTKLENQKNNTQVSQNIESHSKSFMKKKKSAVNEIEVQSVSLSSTNEIINNAVRTVNTGHIIKPSTSRASPRSKPRTNEYIYVNMNRPRKAPKNTTTTDEPSYVNIDQLRGTSMNETWTDEHSYVSIDSPPGASKSKTMTNEHTYVNTGSSRSPPKNETMKNKQSYAQKKNTMTNEPSVLTSDSSHGTPKYETISNEPSYISTSESNISKNETFYHELPIKSDKKANERKDDSAKLNRDPGTSKQNTRDKFPRNKSPDMRKTRDFNTDTDDDMPKIQKRDANTGSNYDRPRRRLREVDTSRSPVYDVSNNSTREINSSPIYDVPRREVRAVDTSRSPVYDVSNNSTREINSSPIYDVPRREVRAVDTSLPQESMRSEDRSIDANLSYDMPREELRNDNLSSPSYESSKIEERNASLSSTLTSTAEGLSLSSGLSHGLIENEISIEKLRSTIDNVRSDDLISPANVSSIFESTKHEEQTATLTSADGVLKIRQLTSTDVEYIPHVPESEITAEMAGKISNDSENIKKLMNINKELKSTDEQVLNTSDGNRDFNTPSTSKRTKTLYREPSAKSVKKETEKKDDSIKLHNDPGTSKRHILDKRSRNQSPDMKKKGATSEASSSGERNVPTRLNESVRTKYHNPQQKTENKSPMKDEAANETYKRSGANSGSLLFRPSPSAKNPHEAIPIKTSSTPRPNRENPINKSMYDDKSRKEQMVKLSGPLKRNPHVNRDEFDRSMKVNIIGNTIRKIHCPICSKSKRPCNHCLSRDGKN
ncbi:hypothetical protein PV326_005805 [Microctonus aethiopoides]|nr:hypothetical protein PV326_005805 [Microctonus aethiopoides]